MHVLENGHDLEVSHDADGYHQKHHSQEADAEGEHEGHDGETEPKNEKRTEGGRGDGQQNRARLHGLPAKEETGQHYTIVKQGEENRR